MVPAGKPHGDHYQCPLLLESNVETGDNASPDHMNETILVAMSQQAPMLMVKGAWGSPTGNVLLSYKVLMPDLATTPTTNPDEVRDRMAQDGTSP